MDDFLDKLFPIAIGQEAWVAPRFSTSISTSDGGFESRNVNWTQSRLQVDAGPGVRSLSDLQLLLDFFREVRGNAIAFRFRDPFDYRTGAAASGIDPDDVSLGVGDGVTLRFPLLKRYGDGECRRITRPVADSVMVAVDGQVTTEWSLADRGIIEFWAPPAPASIITAGFEFDVPVRFEEPAIKVSRKSYLAGEAHSIPLVEVREA